MRMLNPTQLPVGVKVKEAKIADVGNLLEKHFGKNWREIKTLQWYKNVIEGNEGDQVDENEDCECFLDPEEE
ncbi:hypothetical protein WA026_017757 [Henosepilachna vigintioctopunctata]|uniref:Uncharacterized protein n=1 Tax=Henosepilachna vigintioctopunctata TaxID=420089 RepID=A0AAW1U4F6_9CUCU